MGSPGSPAYAICICMYYEHLFHVKMAQIKQTTNNQYNHTNICQGFRYIDDLFAFFAYDKHDKKSFQIAESIKNILTNHTYHPNMTLKEEKHTNNSFDFLETTISYKGNTNFDIKHKDKNFESLYKNNKIKKIKTIEASSFNQKHQPTNIVLNTLHRINTNCSSQHLKLLSTLEYFFVSTKFGYKKKHFKQALQHMTTTTGNTMWHTFTVFLSTAKNRLIQHILSLLDKYKKQRNDNKW